MDDGPETLLRGDDGRYAELLTRHGIDPSQVAPDDNGTIRPRRRRKAATFLIPAAEGLKGIDELAIGETIGQGGMGVVKKAEQLRLRRQVAVKLLLSDDEDVAREHIIREALVTGALEHPNIVPVHTLTEDTAGNPALVMKHIEGVPWGQLLRDPTAHTYSGSARTPREFHLGIFRQVCNAVHFAHSRGIVHRDLKPNNVMIGRFGEVYVLDWGIAVSVSERSAGLAPAADDDLAGTPGFMAPEMARCEGSRIDARTDVYLLGAILHCIITGRPRHEAPTHMMALVAAAESRPYVYDDDVPEELAAICNRATHLDPERRFQSAEELRRAIARFEHNDDARDLLVAARARLDDLREALSEGNATDEAHVHWLYGGARFAFQRALRAWPENTIARAAFDELLLAMIGFHLERDHHAEAKALTAELDRVPDSVRARLSAVETKLRGRREEIASLEQLAKDVDARTGEDRRARNSWMLAGAALVIIGIPTALEQLSLIRGGYRFGIGAALLFLAATASLGYTRRTKTRVAANIAASLVAIVGFFALEMIACFFAGIPYHQGLGISFITIAGCVVVLGLTMYRPIIPAAAPVLLGGAAALLSPQHASVAVLAGTVTAFATVAVLTHFESQRDR